MYTIADCAAVRFRRELIRLGIASAGALLALLLAAPRAFTSNWNNGTWVPLSGPARISPSGVYDPTGDRFLSFGGENGDYPEPTEVRAFDFSNETWSLLATTGTSPSGRSGHSVVYDSLRERLIVFGGYGGGYRNDAWALDLGSVSAWSNITPFGTLPIARSGHAAIYDPVRDRMIILGGNSGVGTQNDVWAFNLSGTPAWTELVPTGDLPPKGMPGSDAIYDPIGDRIIVLPPFPSCGVYELSLSGTPNWTLRFPGGSAPPCLAGVGAVYDPASSSGVFYGGWWNGSPVGDVWTLSLGPTMTWVHQSPLGQAPAPRSNHTVVYDSARDRMVVFGGTTVSQSNELRNDVWALALQGTLAWSAVEPTPPGRYYHVAVFDAAREQMLLLGGAPSSVDVLSLDDDTWSALLPSGTGPHPLSYATATYDPARDRVVLFGGSDAVLGSVVNETWLLTLGPTATWTHAAPTGTPPLGRSGHSAIYDSQRDRIVIFGGTTTNGAQNDSWELSLAGPLEWSQLVTTGTLPGPRSTHTAVYDTPRDRMIVYGGSPSNDLWELALESNEWSQLTPLNQAPDGSHDQHTAVYDFHRERMVVFGGSYRKDVWALSLIGPPFWNELAPEGSVATTQSYGHSAIYDAPRHRMVTYGGIPLQGELWSLAWWEDVTAVQSPKAPISISIEPPFPNPFSASVEIDFRLGFTGTVTLAIYDVSGHLVTTFVDGMLSNGPYRVTWNGEDRFGKELPSGIYFCRLSARGLTTARKIILLR